MYINILICLGQLLLKWSINCFFKLLTIFMSISVLRNYVIVSIDLPGRRYGTRLVKRQIRAEGWVGSAAAGSPKEQTKLSLIKFQRSQWSILLQDYLMSSIISQCPSEINWYKIDNNADIFQIYSPATEFDQCNNQAQFLKDFLLKNL